MRRQRAAALVSVLLVISIAVMAACVLAGSITAGLNFANHNNVEWQARALADSVIAEAVAAEMASNGALGVAPDQSSITVQIGSGTAWLTFSTTPPPGWPLPVPYSTNNLNSQSAVPGSIRPSVPGVTLDLIGVATTGGVKHSSEVVLHIPPFPYAIVNAGNFAADGGLTVASVAASPSPASGASLASNSTKAFYALDISPPATITGNASACGGILVPAKAVAGVVTSNAEAAPVPRIPIASFSPPAANVSHYLDPSGTDLGTTPPGLPGPPGSPPGKPGSPPGAPGAPPSGQSSNALTTLDGYCVASTGLTESGPIELDDAVLYVNGDVTLSGAVSGVGAIFATGKITQQPGASPDNLSSSDSVAMAAGGDVSLLGNSTTDSMFHGLVYTEGNFTADKIALIGAFVGNTPVNSTAPAPAMNLHTTSVQFNQSYTSTSFSVVLPPPPPSSQTDPSLGVQEPDGSTISFGITTDPTTGAYVVTETTTSPTGTVTTTKTQAPVTNPDGTLVNQQAWATNLISSTLSSATSGQNFGSGGWFFNGTKNDPMFGTNDPNLTTGNIAGATSTFVKGIQPSSATGGSSASGGGAAGTSKFNLDVNNFLTLADKLRLDIWRDI